MIGNVEKQKFLKDKVFYLKCIRFWFNRSLNGAFIEQRPQCRELAENFMKDLKTKTEIYEHRK